MYYLYVIFIAQPSAAIKRRRFAPAEEGGVKGAPPPSPLSFLRGRAARKICLKVKLLRENNIFCATSRILARENQEQNLNELYEFKEKIAAQNGPVA